MIGLIFAIFLGWAGVYRFYKGQTGLGVLYLFTFGLFGIGWIIDVIQAFNEYRNPKATSKSKGNGAIISDVVGCFAECRKNEGIKRKDVINTLSPNCPLLLETAYWEGKPFFLVVDPQSGLDIGALPKENSGFLKNTYPNASFKVRLMEKDLNKPVIEIEVINNA